MKYRKKPVVIEAELFVPHSIDRVIEFIGINCYESVDIDGINDGLVIETLEGDMKASYGDFIIKGINGEFYPCKPDIFDKTYEKVEE